VRRRRDPPRRLPGAHLCGDHLRRSVEKRAKRRIREDTLLDPDATPDDPDRWVIGLSGGKKDSVALTQILDDVFGKDPRVEMLALTIHEGIEGYRDESIDATIELTEDPLDPPRGRLLRGGVRRAWTTWSRATRRTWPPARTAACSGGTSSKNTPPSFDADKLLTGHNLDDEAQTAMMNFLEGDVRQVAKHFDASLGPFDERGGGDAFVPRAKPLRDVPEKEIALYCHVRDLPTHMAECPHSSEAYRGEIQSTIHDLEENHPGARHSIMAGYEELSALAAEAYREGRRRRRRLARPRRVRALRLEDEPRRLPEVPAARVDRGGLSRPNRITARSPPVRAGRAGG